MSIIAGLNDISGGPPADIGKYVLSSSAVVFPFTFSGTVYYAAIRTGVQGWILISYGTVPETVINAAFTTLGAGARVIMMDATYTLAAAGISFTADQQVLEGQGRGSFIDGDALATTVHAINLDGYCCNVIRNLSIQTEDGGGKTCYCIYIDNALRFMVEGVYIVASDHTGIYVDSTLTDIYGIISGCYFLGDCDDNGIFIDCEQNIVIGCQSTGGDHFELSDRNNAVIGNSLYMSNIVGTVATHSVVSGNKVQYAIIDFDVSCCCVIDGNSLDHSYILIDEYDIVSNNEMYFSTYGIVMENGSHGYNIVVGNKMRIVRNNGIDVFGDGNIIADNWIDSVDTQNTNSKDGIQLGADSSDNIITGNVITNRAPYDNRDGIHFLGNNDDCIIKDNRIDGYDVGINITAATCERNMVKDNVFSNCTAMFTDAGTDTKTPEIFMPVTDPDGTIGDHPCIVLTDGDDTLIRFQIPVHMDFQELVRGQVLVVPGGTGDIQWSTDADWGKIGAAEAYNAGSDSETDQTTGVTVNRISPISMNGSLTGIAAGDLVGFEFTRRGTQAGDTVDADCYFLGFRLQYV